jgi:hypothetical protein
MAYVMNVRTYVQTAYKTFTLKSGITKYSDGMKLRNVLYAQ